MSRAVINESSLTAIGNAIRNKTGGTEKLSVPSGMVEAINGITTKGSGLSWAAVPITTDTTVDLSAYVGTEGFENVFPETGGFLVFFVACRNGETLYKNYIYYPKEAFIIPQAPYDSINDTLSSLGNVGGSTSSSDVSVTMQAGGILKILDDYTFKNGNVILVY